MRKIIAISLAILIISVNMGFAVATHYCCGVVVESQLVLGKKKLDCGMSDIDQSPCKLKQPVNTQLSKKSCCQNRLQTIDIDDNFEFPVSFSNVILDYVTTFYKAIILIIFPHSVTLTEFSDYSPPILNLDRAILYQVFII
ncbi:MAG: hypothetical protein WBA74_21550 [Cyclobacteriaceae bacterium]